MTRFALKVKQPTTRYVPRVVKHEQSLQLQVCRYLDLKWPNILYRSDFASGLHLTPYQAKLHKQMQSSRAFPDMQILKPSRGYAGLFIELKPEGTRVYTKKGTLSADPHIQEQAMMLQHLNGLGYFARFGIGYDSCIRLIEWYLNPDYRASENTELF